MRRDVTRTRANEGHCRLYRAKVIFSMPDDLKEELEWLDSLSSAGSMKYLKNFQIWFVLLVTPDAPQQPGSLIPSSSTSTQAPPPNYHGTHPHPSLNRNPLPRSYAFQRRQELPCLVVSAMARTTLLPLGHRTSLRGNSPAVRRP